MKYYLLDYIAHKVDAHYLSQLKNKGIMRTYLILIQKLSIDDFTFEDWKDACEYLTGSSETINTKQEAKKRIIEWIQT